MNKKALSILHIICGIIGVILYIYSIENNMTSGYRILAFFLMILGFSQGVTGLKNKKN